LRGKHEVKEEIIVLYSRNKQFSKTSKQKRLLRKINLKIRPLLIRLTFYSHHCYDTASITPDLRKVTECIPNVR
jgi:hypothetical protein